MMVLGEWRFLMSEVPLYSRRSQDPTWSQEGGVLLSAREIGNLLPNSQRQRRACYALCHVPHHNVVYDPFINHQLVSRNHFRSLFGANFITYPVDFRGVEILDLHGVV